MRSVALAALTALLTVSACQDLGTNPTASIDANVGNALGGGFSGGNPPPPPIDSGSVGVASTQDQSAPTFTVQFSVTYFMNKPENSGWLKFNRDGDKSTDVDNSAAIKLTNGVWSGKGTIRLLAGGGTFIIDLSKSDFRGTSFEDCGDSRLTAGEGSCFNALISGDGVSYVKKGETTSHAATLTLRPALKSTDTCVGDFTEGCLITVGN
jgi:hypothetical protein